MLTQQVKHFVTGAILLIILLPGVSFTQQVTGTYITSGTDAGKFAVDPLYLNPATASGAVGLFSNPAAISRVSNYELGFTFGFTQRNSANFTTELIKGTDDFDPVSLQSEIVIKETGGISSFAVGKRFGRFSIGGGFEQPRRGGLEVSAGGSTLMDFNFNVDHPITRENLPELPADSIPMNWDIKVRSQLVLSSEPAELYVSSLPIHLAAGLELGPLSLGLGAKYVRITSSNNSARLVADLEASAEIVGRPYGIDPASNLPWQGSVNAIIQLNDRPFDAEYQLGLKGSRLAFSAGANINLKLLKLGLTVERGFPATLTGSYRIKVISTNGLQKTPELKNVSLDIANLPQVNGSAELFLENFTKDSMIVSSSKELRLGGYTGVGGGIHFLIFGLFAGAQMPNENLDFGSAYFGGYIDLPIFYTPVRIRTGIIQRTGFFMSETEDIIPYYTVADFVAGSSVKVGLTRLLPALKEPVLFQFGLRTSIYPLALQLIEDDLTDLSDKKLPSLTDALTINFGMRIGL